MSGVLRRAEEEQRAYVGTALAMLIRGSADVEGYASYPMVLGDIAGRMEVADRLAALRGGEEGDA